MTTIKLPKGEWEYDPQTPLGKPGGFGQVFVGRRNGYDRVAVKRLHLRVNDAAHRELEIAAELSQLTLEHVIPVLDAGQDALSDYYFVVMPCAEKSLQDEINAVGKFNDTDSVRILQDISAGLVEARKFVHRDLKPLNILFHDGRWKIADFGIARFVEDSTSLQTLKDCISPPYAAPEQFKLEHATPATDIYALGCIAYALLTGHPPFKGPTKADFRNQHLSSVPTPIVGINPRLSSLISMVVRKLPNTRPTIDRVSSLLSDIASAGTKGNPGGGLSSLAQAGAAHAAASLKADAALSEQQAKTRDRSELADIAITLLQQEIIEILFKKILDEAPSANRIGSLEVRLGEASLYVRLKFPTHPVPEAAFRSSGWDVITGARIAVVQRGPRPYEWSANLWYTRLGDPLDYRWWEVQYMTNPLSRGKHEFEPFAIDNLEEADLAASPVMGVIQFGSKLRLVDDENVDDFCNRWTDLLAKAFNGQLTHPSLLPLRE